MLPTALLVTGYRKHTVWRRYTGLLGASLEAHIHADSNLRLHHVCRVWVFFGNFLFPGTFKNDFILLLPPPKLEDGIISALAFILAVCQDTGG